MVRPDAVTLYSLRKQRPKIHDEHISHACRGLNHVSFDASTGYGAEKGPPGGETHPPGGLIPAGSLQR